MPSTVQPGEILLGKYSVERVLGQGGMGIVVAARHVHLGELFAIKMLLPEAMTNSEAVGRFLREARASAKLKGEHVARVHDVGSLDNGTPYMVLEHLDGQDLKKVVRSRGALPLEEAALYVYQACEAVSEAHANGIVHRDLKPANLFLIRRPNGSPCVKVLDFGISKEIDSTNQLGSDLTRTGAFMGSPLYMSPEQMANIKAADTRTDIWALGVILYELAVGQVPFTAQAVTELVTKVLTGSPIPPSQARPGIPPALDAIVSKCLEKRPEHRFQTAQELMTQLLPFVQNIQQAMMQPRAPQPSVAAFSPVPPQVVAAALPVANAFPATVVMDMQTGTTGNPQAASTNVAASHIMPNAPADGVTAGAWGQTSKVPGRKDRKGLIAGGVAIAVIGLVAGIFAMSGSGADVSKTDDQPAVMAKPAAMPESSVMTTPKDPAAEAAPTVTNEPATEPVATAKTQTSPPAETPKSTSAGANANPGTAAKSKATAVKPTSGTKKPSIADFND